MKQLEQRVETLVGMLSANGVHPSLLPNTDLHTFTTTGSDTTDPVELDESSVPCDTPDTPCSSASDAFAPYDPVETGLMEEEETVRLLNEFRQESSDSFPFVIVESSVNAISLRREQPFLFLSIMAATTYRTPNTQCVLAGIFRDQVAVRIVQNSHKGLEMLQGLLVYSAYYHYYYRPGKQQLALMIQMSVAMAQEIGLSKKCRNRDVTDTAPLLSAAENRALLGTYHLAAAYVSLKHRSSRSSLLTITRFAQAWRKRTTVPYTRAIARACQSFSQRPEYPSDLLITPLVQSSELMCRINDYFSYDDIEDSEIRGETMLKLSTTNFSAELQRLRDATPEPVKMNCMLIHTNTNTNTSSTLTVRKRHITSGGRHARRDGSRVLSTCCTLAIAYESSDSNDKRTTEHASTFTCSIPDICAYTARNTIIVAQGSDFSGLVRMVLFDVACRENTRR
jgi:hypothetical protein